MTDRPRIPGGTMTPKRIQLSRKKGWRKPEGAVVVSRPGDFGNPWLIGSPGRLDTKLATMILPRDLTRVAAVEQFDAWLYGYGIPNGMRPGNLTREGRRAIWDELSARRAVIFNRLPELRGRDLCCWCPLDQPCHADVLIRMANAGGET